MIRETWRVFLQLDGGPMCGANACADERRTRAGYGDS